MVTELSCNSAMKIELERAFIVVFKKTMVLLMIVMQFKRWKSFTNYSNSDMRVIVKLQMQN